MKSIHCSLHNFLLASLFFYNIFTSHSSLCSRGILFSRGSKTLDNYSADNLDVFKFSINNILNSDGEIVEKPA